MGRVDKILDDLTYHAFGRVVVGVNKQHYYGKFKQELLELIKGEIDAMKIVPINYSDGSEDGLVKREVLATLTRLFENEEGSR